MESAKKNLSFASASDTKYERIQALIQTIEVSGTAVAAATITTTSPITVPTVLRRRSSIVSTEPHPTGHIFGKEKAFDDSPENAEKVILDSIDEKHNSNGVGFREYVSVLARHPSYRAYLASHLCQNLGDYFVRIANVLVVENLITSQNDNGSGSALAHVTLARLLPNAIFALVGGILADRFNKRNLMVSIDCISGLVVLGYLMAISYESLSILYGVTILRSTLSATYYPPATGILVDLVGGDESNNINTDKSAPSLMRRDLQLAVTLNSWAWGGSVIVGGLLAGKLASLLGLKACYFIDCVTYWTSALLIAKGIRPDYKKTGIKTGEEINNTESFRNKMQENFANTNECENRTLFGYLVACGFGWMVFAKPSASLVWGIEDIVGAQFATVFRDDGTEDTALSSIHMGLLFSTIGLGCSLGPILLNTITDARKPYTLQRACLIGLILLGLGWLAIYFVDTFPQFLLGSFLRTMGSGTAWVFSSLILQTLCSPTFLGRVLALEHTLSTLFEAATSFVAGNLSTSRGLTDNQLALVGAEIGLVVVVVWGLYYIFSLGAAHPRFNCSSTSKSSYEMVAENKEIKMENQAVPENIGTNPFQSRGDGLV